MSETDNGKAMGVPPPNVFVPTESGVAAYHRVFSSIDIVPLDQGVALVRMRRGEVGLEARLDCASVRHLAALLTASVAPARLEAAE